MTNRNADVTAALAAPYHRVFQHEVDGGYSAFVLEHPGVYGAGATIELANRTLEEAWADWIALELEAGRSVPPPAAPEDYSGRITFRIPPTLHLLLTQRAQLEGVSLNRLLSDAAAQYAGITDRPPHAMHIRRSHRGTAGRRGPQGSRRSRAP